MQEVNALWAGLFRARQGLLAEGWSEAELEAARVAIGELRGDDGLAGCWRAWLAERGVVWR